MQKASWYIPSANMMALNTISQRKMRKKYWILEILCKVEVETGYLRGMHETSPTWAQMEVRAGVAGEQEELL